MSSEKKTVLQFILIRFLFITAILIAAILAFMAGEPSEEGGDDVL